MLINLSHRINLAVAILLIATFFACSCKKKSKPLPPETVLSMMQGDYNQITVQYYWEGPPISWTSTAVIERKNDTTFSFIENALIHTYYLRADNIYSDSAYIRIQWGEHQLEEFTYLIKENRYSHRYTVDTFYKSGGLVNLHQKVTIAIKK